MINVYFNKKGIKNLENLRENEDGKSVSVIGMTTGNRLLNVKDKNGNTVSVEGGYYITSLTSIAYGWQEGDRITLYNPLSLEKSEITVDGIIQNNVQKSIICGKSLAAKLTGLDEAKFNCILSDKALDIPDGKIAKEVKASSISDQAKTMTEQMDFLLWIIIVLGVIICVAAVYVAVNMMVTESRSNISMLKVLGYRDNQINRIVLRSHHILLPVGILLSIPATFGACRAFFKLMVDYGVMLIDPYIAPQSYMFSFGLTALCYFGSLLLLRRKVKRVDMIESLKDNRE